MNLVDKLSRRFRGEDGENASQTTAETGSEERSLARGGTRGHSGEERLDASDLAVEEDLRHRLQEDPNDQRAFEQLVAIIRKRAIAEAQQTEGAQHSDADPGLTGAIDLDLRKVSQDAIWAVAEELAGNSRAWYPLIEMARLSVADDREAALRRLGTAADREPSGEALLAGLRMLRREELAGEALSLGTGHWRPKEHSLEVGREMVEAALDADRPGDARRNLEAIASHPDTDAAERLTKKLAVRVPAAPPTV